jgi:tRNA modification GTPase
MNYMLGRDRAIVTDIAGTTRDTLEESMTVNSFPIRIIDTAGMRQPGDSIEAIGIERTHRAIDEAFAVIGVFDGSQTASAEDLMVMERLKKTKKPVIMVRNKVDLPKRLDEDFFAGHQTVRISALKFQGLEKLIAAIA